MSIYKSGINYLIIFIAMNMNNKKTFLFLHGYIQSGHIFETRLKNMTKKLTKKYTKTQFEFLFPDAPVVLPEQTVPGETQRGWMQIEGKAEDFLKMEKANYLGMSESIKEIYKIGETNQNIECIFGFSQGAEMLMFLVLLSLYKGGEYDLKKYFPNLKCIVFVAGFYRPIPKNEEFTSFADELMKEECKKCDIPSLHVYGLSDALLDCSRSKESLKFFTCYEEFPHNGKHFVPSGKADIEKFEAYFEKYLNLQ